MFPALRIPIALLAALLVAAICAGRAESAGSATCHQPSTGSSYPRKLYPADESRLDPTLVLFKQVLLEAAERGDVGFLREALSPTVSYESDSVNRDDLLRRLNLREGSPWRGLRDALRLGVSEWAGVYCAPYVFGEFGKLNLEVGLPLLVIAGKNVRVRSRQSADSPVIETLSYDIVPVGPQGRGVKDPEIWDREDQPQGPDAWVQIVTPGGRVGYVYRGYARSPGDTRYCFRKVNSVWQLWAIATGD